MFRSVLLNDGDSVMKLCRDCRQRVWPYLIVIFVASFAAFLTWLTLASAGAEPHVKMWWSGGAFLSVCVILLSYMISCMRRHCGHGRSAGAGR